MNRLPLSGIRILDFSMVIAGPYATTLLAFLGAEVIKVESKVRPDHERVLYRARFHDLNMNKLSITLNLTDPKAVEIAKRVAGVSDAGVENFRPGVMKKMGLGYEALKEVRPDIVMISMSGFGATGPEAKARTFAAIFSAMGGLAHITGYHDGIPTELRGSIDTMSGQLVAFALLVALMHRRRSGQGQHIDFAARGGIVSPIGGVMMDYAMNRRNQGPKGNRDDFMAPHNCYRCKGENKWVTIAVENDEEWRSLCQAMGAPSLSDHPDFMNTLSRWENQEKLDQVIERWTSKYSDYEIMEMLQKVGVAAVPCFSADELFNDPHLQNRGFIKEVEHPVEGKWLAFGPPWRLSASPVKIERYGNDLGQDNDCVFGKLLGMAPEEIVRLKEEKVIY